MASPLKTIIEAGTKLWLDSIDPDLVTKNRAMGATGATSNPIIIADLLKTGRFDDRIHALAAKGLSSEDIAWTLTDELVSRAEQVFLPVYEATRGDDGYVSFELDPLLEDVKLGPPHKERVERYVELGKKWAKGHPNRMIKIPATPAGIDSLEELAAHGVSLNVTLMFTERQYQEARDAVWRGARRLGSLDRFKSVYSIFVSRLDVYTEKEVPTLSSGAQGLVGILNAKRLWAMNQKFWAENRTPLKQEIIFASTGTKKPTDPAWKYVAALAGSDIETNPPATNDAVEASGRSFTREVDMLPPPAIVAEIDEKVDWQKLEDRLMEEGLAKFADPQKALLDLVASKRQA